MTHRPYDIRVQGFIPERRRPAYQPLYRHCGGSSERHDGQNPRLYVIGLGRVQTALVLCDGCVAGVRAVAPVREDMRRG